MKKSILARDSSKNYCKFWPKIGVWDFVKFLNQELTTRVQSFDAHRVQLLTELIVLFQENALPTCDRRQQTEIDALE